MTRRPSPEIPPAHNLPQVLRWRAEHHPDQPAYLFLRDGLNVAGTLTYGALDARARAVAAYLRSRFAPGDRLLLAFPPGLSFVEAFWGTLYAELVAVPVPPLDSVRLKQSAARFHGIALDAGCAGIVSSQAMLSTIRGAEFGALPIPLERWVSIEALDPSWADQWKPLDPTPGSLAYLQYTSGSTSSPKGAMVSHDNLVHQSRYITEAGCYDADSTTLSWMPHFHDYGLVKGIVQPLWIGRPTYLMSPLVFLKRPGRWLEAIQRYGISHSGGPNFAYRRCVEAVEPATRRILDLSGWRVASCGAEPIAAETVRRFSEAFAPAGFRPESFFPAYGMAEFTLLISLKPQVGAPGILTLDPDRLERGVVREAAPGQASARAVVSCGRPVGDTEVAIVHPETLSRCAAQQVGEIWLRGGSTTLGYWNRPEETEQTFHAMVRDTGEGPFLRTGDLGFIKDGELYVTGRLKDLLIVRGRNHYPQDIERTVEHCDPAFRSGGAAAFSILEDGEEHVVVVQELSRHEGSLEIEEIAGRVRAAVSEAHDLHVAYVVLIKSGSLPKTSSGKIQRRTCRQQFLAGQLAVVGISVSRPSLQLCEPVPPTADVLQALSPERRRDAIAAYLRGLIAMRLQLEEGAVPLDRPAQFLGLDSLLTAELLHGVESAFGTVLSLQSVLGGATLNDLAGMIANRSITARARPDTSAGEAVGQEACYFLSENQAALWFLSQLSPDSPAANVAVLLRLPSTIDQAILRQALSGLSARHATLRTTYETREDIPVQLVHDSLPLDWMPTDASGWRWEQIRAAALDAAAVPFDIIRGPVWRARLFKGPESSLLLLVAHHIAVDGWSMTLLVEELRREYEQRVKGGTDKSAPDPAPAPYTEYVAWHKQLLESEEGARLARYWQGRLAGEWPNYEAFYDRPRATIEPEPYAWHRFAVGLELSRKIKAVAKSEGTTSYAVCLAALQVVLHRYTHHDDVAIASPVFGRHRARFAQSVGDFVNVVMLRNTLHGEMTGRELLGATKRTVLEALDHQDYPFTRLATELRSAQDRRQGALSQVLFVLQRFKLLAELDEEMDGRETDRAAADHSAWEAYVLPQHSGQFDLCLELSEGARGMSGYLEFKSGLFDASTMARFQRHFVRALEGLVSSPGLAIDELSLMDDAEQRAVLDQWSGGRAPIGEAPCVQQLIEAQAHKTPDAVAVELGDRRLTYRELNARANRVAHYLRRRGVGPDVVVGLCLDRTPDMIVGLLGILKSGGAYLPLDADYPTERLEYMLADSKVRVIVTQQDQLSRLPVSNSHTVCLDSEWAEIERCPDGEAFGASSSGNLVYVMYTSGSTGHPKGVLIEQRSLANYVQAVTAAVKLQAGDRVLQFASLSFDTAAEEIFPCLAAGGTLVLRHATMADSVSGFLESCAQSKVTVLDLPTAYWHEVVMRMEVEGIAWPNSIRHVIIGGERALPQVLEHWARLIGRKVGLLNTYGPTEATIAATFCDLTGCGCESPLTADVPIGRPIAHVTVYVLDQKGRPVPIGVAGELHIGGVGVARGYLGRSEATATRFIPDPFSGRSGARIYRTGDLVRWRSDGQLEYRGRVDRQVKIRGYRIELEEIEAVLNRQPEFEQAVVELREDQPGDKRIAAFLVPRPDSRLGLVQLRERLRNQLPAHMIPSSFTELEALPKTPNGKVDRQALRVALDSRASKVDVTADYVAPRTAAEQLLAHIWGEILHVKDVGIHDNFFELGGHSLLATQLVSRVQSLFQVRLPLRRVFDTPTIATLADVIGDASATTRPIRDETARVIKRVPRGEPLPLSFAQERMWVLYQMAPDAAAYNIPASVRLHGPLNTSALRGAVQQVVARHEALRTTFVKVEGRARQVIHDRLEPEWRETDLRLLARDQREAQASELAMAEARRPFDLARGPLVRVLLMDLGEEDHVLMVTTHHIISDQWSYGIIARELVACYNAACEGRPVVLKPELAIQYADFAQWQRQWLTGPVQREQMAYWTSKLANLPVMSLPGDRPRPPVHSFKGDHVSIDLPWALINRLKQLSVREGVTLYMLFLAGFFALIHRLTQQRDIVIGTPIANRHWLAIEDLIGTFVNTLVLRADVSPETTFHDLLAKIRDLSLEAYAHQDMPFEKLVEELRPDRSHGVLPLVQILFNFANTPFARTEFVHLSWTPYEVSRGAAQLDLGLSIDPLASRKAYLEFNSDLFDRATVERWLMHYRQFMEAIAQEPHRAIGRLPVLTSQQRRRMLQEWNATDAHYPNQQCVAQLFEEQASRTPDAVALVVQGLEFSYAELNRRANRLAHWLREQGVGPDVVVPVCLERSADLVVSLLAVMKAGGAYLPLVPGLPARRLAAMLEASLGLVLITESPLLAGLPQHQLQVLCVDRDAVALAERPAENPAPVAEPRHLAYVLFTSGSTGQPKGVEIEQGALVNFLESMRREPGLTRRDTLLAITPLSFDIAGLELYLPLIAGARIILATRKESTDGEWLARELDRGAVTVMQATPATWRMVIASGWRGGRGVKVLCGGEAMPKELAQELVARAGSVWNVYGPTETTIWSTLERVRSVDRTVPIGKPIANTRVYVLDPQREPVPVGIPGELYIGGAGLARGYRGAPTLTQERFVPSPFREGERLYRTGDQVKWLPDGRMDYIGRIDYQVKLRGFRIELGEIESVLAQDASVKQAVVVVREDVPGDKRLVAYVTAQEGMICDPPHLRRSLRETVPDYMVPAAIVLLSSFPLTPNGKVDRAALPVPDVESHQDDVQVIPPRNRIELQLAAIWEQVLGVTHVSVKDNFFDLGGYSLLALRIFSAIERTFGKRLPMAVLFQAPTIEQLADLLADEGCTVRWHSLVAIQPEGTQTPFFAVPGVGGNVLVFARLAKLLGEDRPFYGLQARGLDGREKPFMRVEEMAAHYITEIRSVQPHGPYLIGGTCTGGLTAYEIAQQLRAQGEQVVLAIMESWHPRSYQTHWHRPPYILWPLQFMTQKVRTYLRLMRDLPAEQWPAFWRGKLKQLWNLMHHTEAAEHQDEFLYKDQVTYAMFHAAARYELKLFHGPVLNVIASKHPLTHSADDTRLVFGSSALGRSQTLYLPAEDSGRLFVAPHVQDLAGHLQRFWAEALADLHPHGDDEEPGLPSRVA